MASWVGASLTTPRCAVSAGGTSTAGWAAAAVPTGSPAFITRVTPVILATPSEAVQEGSLGKTAAGGAISRPPICTRVPAVAADKWASKTPRCANSSSSIYSSNSAVGVRGRALARCKANCSPKAHSRRRHSARLAAWTERSMTALHKTSSTTHSSCRRVPNRLCPSSPWAVGLAGRVGTLVRWAEAAGGRAVRCSLACPAWAPWGVETTTRGAPPRASAPAAAAPWAAGDFRPSKATPATSPQCCPASREGPCPRRRCSADSAAAACPRGPAKAAPSIRCCPHCPAKRRPYPQGR